MAKDYLQTQGQRPTIQRTNGKSRSFSIAEQQEMLATEFPATVFGHEIRAYVKN